MSVKCPFITNLVPGKVEKENHIRKVQNSVERKVKNIGKENLAEKSFFQFNPPYGLNYNKFLDFIILWSNITGKAP